MYSNPFLNKIESFLHKIKVKSRYWDQTSVHITDRCKWNNREVCQEYREWRSLLILRNVIAAVAMNSGATGDYGSHLYLCIYFWGSFVIFATLWKAGFVIVVFVQVYSTDAAAHPQRWSLICLVRHPAEKVGIAILSRKPHVDSRMYVVGISQKVTPQWRHCMLIQYYMLLISCIIRLRQIRQKITLFELEFIEQTYGYGRLS